MTARQQVDPQQVADIQSRNIQLAPNPATISNVDAGQPVGSSVPVYSTNPMDQVAPAPTPTVAITPGAGAAAAPPIAKPPVLHSEAEVASKVSFCSLHPESRQKL